MSNNASITNDRINPKAGERNATEEVNLLHSKSQILEETTSATKVTSGGKVSESNATAEVESERKEEYAIITEAESHGQFLDGAVDARGQGEVKDEGEKEPVQNTDPIGLADEDLTGGHATQVTAGVQDHEGSQDAVEGSSKAMLPQPIPLPRDASLETLSIIASTISNHPLEIDDSDGFDDNDLGFSDTDSAIMNNMQGSTNSVQSSLYDFVEVNGRTFHRYKEGKYALPNDEIEQNRLDLQHQMISIMLDGKLHLAPIDPNLQDALDIGTGTGIWAIEFATKYPSAKVIGTDLSPIQPEYVPPNCQFEVDDAEDDWMFSQPFDFVHMRGMMTAFASPKDIIAKAYNALKPGGYLEMAESIFPMHCHDNTLEGTALDTWGKACVEAGKVAGREWTNGVHYRRWLDEVGFEDVKEKKFELATSTWPKGRKQKELGMWWQADLLEALGGSLPFICKHLGWQPAEVERLLVDVRKDIKNRGVHAFVPIRIVYGRKPK